MGSLCLSAATILRCERFTSLESQVLIIPTALELIFSTTLVITNWGTGWRHLLLTAEGWSYFALALLELLSHTLPAVRDSVTVFSVVDIVLGATSFLPIFFYTFFVYLFTRGELIDTLPKRFQNIANVLLLFFIPAIVALNELSSFVGISRRTIGSGERQVVAIGFRTSSDQDLWTFLTSLTLALLTAFEAINFCFAFYRLVRAFIDQRRIETTSSDQAHLIRGIGWITGGFKLGAVETVIGFAQGGFGGALTRRILRFLARAFLIIGIVKGVDQFDDFSEVTKELSSSRQQARRSRLGLLISNPRFSTFRQLTPTASAFRPNEPMSEKNDGPRMSQFAQVKRDLSQLRTTRDSDQLRPPMTADSVRYRSPLRTQIDVPEFNPNQRVTVHFDKGAPTLHMRFSGLEMPSPAVIAESVKARPVSSSWVSIARSSQYATSTVPSFAFDPPMPTGYPEFIIPKPAQQRSSEYSRRSSYYPESLTAASVSEIASQFPGPPPIPVVPRRPSPIAERSEWDDGESQMPSIRPPEPDFFSYDGPSTPVRPSPQADSAYGASPDAPPMRYAYGGMEYPESPEPVFRYAYDGPASPEQIQIPNHPYAVYSPPMARAENQTPGRSDTTYGTTPMTHFSRDEESYSSTPGTEDPFEYDEAPLRSGKGKAVMQPVNLQDGPRQEHGRQESRSSAALLQMTQRGDGGVSEAWTPPEFTPSMLSLSDGPSRRNTLKKRRPSQGASVETYASSWLHGDMDADADDEQLASRVPVPVRVKSVGRVRAPHKTTPAPVHVRNLTRGSIYIQPITVPPASFSSEVQIVQGGSSADSFNSEFGDRR
ncbi:hypothetical protein FB45DRAFT_1059473 [Roridomyces roridus]|uniref:Uncharacterized protein n=1 Tax=Roridomyces roridus TaxID=1738132 RepID=A0AAD7BRZ4_9AGAR|nr:hypothetical protein FB45DRAFT_1059473 [Roridomyces roridus]